MSPSNASLPGDIAAAGGGPGIGALKFGTPPGGGGGGGGGGPAMFIYRDCNNSLWCIERKLTYISNFNFCVMVSLQHCPTPKFELLQSLGKEDYVYAMYIVYSSI